ncbi:MAG: AAA family ATPase [Treponema sp.]|jgi:type II secretory pathway predicted ATPase ExeA|nr:AAA family ATPase [Treponema sp.]
MMTLKTYKKFGITQDPFSGDVVKPEDVYLTDDTRFVAEYLLQAAKVGGMVALVGESGSGKTTIRRYAIDRMTAEGEKVRIIAPRCVDKTRLTTSTICDAIIADCSTETPRRTLEAKARQVERILTNSSRSGYSHILMIEEAHDLNIQTLKYLKRFWEMEDGFKKLLSIVLIGQIELKAKLDEGKNWEAREVIRRMEILELEPLGTGFDIGTYSPHKTELHSHIKAAGYAIAGNLYNESGLWARVGDSNNPQVLYTAPFGEGSETKPASMSVLLLMSY